MTLLFGRELNDFMTSPTTAKKDQKPAPHSSSMIAKDEEPMYSASTVDLEDLMTVDEDQPNLQGQHGQHLFFQ